MNKESLRKLINYNGARRIKINGEFPKEQFIDTMTSKNTYCGKDQKIEDFGVVRIRKTRGFDD